jgi:1-acyl-sn-glycerol-3-phosphate acyltransferase
MVKIRHYCLRATRAKFVSQHNKQIKKEPGLRPVPIIKGVRRHDYLYVSLNLAVSVSERPPFWSSVLRWLASFANSWVHFVPLLLVSPFSRSAAWAIYRNWARITYRIFGITLSLQDDNEGNLAPRPHLYVWLNQSSLTEAFAHVQLLPPWYTIANIEYAMMPFLGWAMVPLRNVVIVRQWKAQAKRGIERAAVRLARGEAWLISIEGARSPDGRLSPYKKGPVVMALRCQATIIPVAVHGAREVMPRGEWRIRPGHIELHLLKAIPTSGLTYDDRDAVLEKLYHVAERELAQHGAQQGTKADGPAA